MRGTQNGRQECRIEVREPLLDLANTADQQQPPKFQIARMRGVDPVAMIFQQDAGGIERFGGPAEIPRCQRNLGFCHDASCARHRFFRAERACGASHQRFRAPEVAKLRHCNAAQRERRRVVAQRDLLQCSKRIARRERTRGRRDQRVHGRAG